MLLCDGWVQYCIVELGEVLLVGGKVFNVVDLFDVYMMFFLFEMVVGCVLFGVDVWIVFDVVLEYVILVCVLYVLSMV